MWYGVAKGTGIAALALLITTAWLSVCAPLPVFAQASTRVTEVRPLPAEKVFVALSPEQLSQRRRLLLGYSIAVVVASIAGGFLPDKIRLTHTRLQVLMSFVGGLMLGVALFHLLLHALLDTPRNEISGILTSLGLGILLMFLLLRAFHFHQHDVSPQFLGREQDGGAPGCQHGHDHDHDHAHSHERIHSHEHVHAQHRAPGTDDKHLPVIDQPVPPAGPEEHSPAAGTESAMAAPLFEHPYSWLGIALGLGLHSIMDGVALSASLLRQSAASEETAFWGLATFLAILLHKPLDAISITSVMSASGWSKTNCTLVNVSFAMMCPLGALLAWWGILGTHSHVYVVSHLLAFSAGIFLCISLSDLLPEMQFHAHNQGILTLSLMAGLGLAWGLMYWAPIHGM